MAFVCRYKPFMSEDEAWHFAGADEFAGYLTLGRWRVAYRVHCHSRDCRGFLGLVLPWPEGADGAPQWTVLLRQHFGGLAHRAGPDAPRRISPRRRAAGRPLGRGPRPQWHRELGGDSWERLGPTLVPIPPCGVRVDCPSCRTPLRVTEPPGPTAAQRVLAFPALHSLFGRRAVVPNNT